MSSSLENLSPGYQAFKDVMGVDELVAWHEQVKSGQLAFNPADRIHPDDPDVLSDALTIFVSDEVFEKAKPVLEWMVQQGLSPWTARYGAGTSAYQDLCLWSASPVESPVLNWCLSLPVAPTHVESDVSQRLRSDALDALLLDHPQLGSQWQLNALVAKGFSLTQQWADGRTTLDRMLSLELVPDDWFKRFTHDRHMEKEFMRGYRRLASALLKESPQDPSVHALYLLAAMQGFRSSNYLRLINAERSWETYEWHAPLRGLMSDIARAYGFKGSAASQHTQVWQSALHWASQQPPSLMLAGAILGASQVQCRNEMAQDPKDATRRRRGWDIMMEAGAAITGHLEGVGDSKMAEAYSTFSWQTGFQLALDTIKDDGGKKVACAGEMFEHPGIWPLALPNIAFFSAFGGEAILSSALAQGNVWPRTPTFMRMATADRFLNNSEIPLAQAALDAQHAQCRQDSLDEVFPQPEVPPARPRVRM